MKIAIASDDQKTISHHFGRAAGFVIVEIKEGKLISRTYKANSARSEGHGSCDHQAMIGNIKDCKYVISYGMGQKIYDDLEKSKIIPIVTDEIDVDCALDKFLKNNLENRTEKLH